MPRTVFRMGSTYKWIVARPGRDKLYHYGLAFVAQRVVGDDERIVFRKDAVEVQTILSPGASSRPG